MRDIAGSSRKMTKLVEVLDGIAFQSSILALNAAVAAASVTANESELVVVAAAVRDLARRGAAAVGAFPADEPERVS